MISAVLIVKNGEKYLADCLKSLTRFSEVVILDTGSTDRTKEIATSFQNVKWFEHPFEGFGASKNRAASLATHDWIFSIDCDEVLTPELSWDLDQLELNPGRVYRLSRQSYYNHKLIRGCGWSPDYVLRLYHRKHCQFNDNRVHESLEVNPGMSVVDLEGSLKHYPYDSVHSLIDKAQFYSALYAQQHAGQKKASPSQALVHGLAAFLKGYVLRKGFLDGYEGLVISISQGLASWLKYIKLYEANQKRQFRD